MSDLRELCERLAEGIEERWAEFEGHAVRADAGEAGMIYVALRGAKGELQVGEALAEKLDPWLEERLDAHSDSLGFAVSIGRSDRDLLLQVDVRSLS